MLELTSGSMRPEADSQINNAEFTGLPGVMIFNFFYFFD